MNYYCLIAGLPDLQLDQAKNLPSMETLLEELQGTLSAADAAWLRLLQMQYDNRNLLAYLADKNAPLQLQSFQSDSYRPVRKNVFDGFSDWF